MSNSSNAGDFTNFKWNNTTTTITDTNGYAIDTNSFPWNTSGTNFQFMQPGQIIKYSPNAFGRLAPRKSIRRKAVKEEGWIEIGDWFVAPKSVIRDYEENLTEGSKWTRRLAHKCSDDSIRAPNGIKIYHRKKGGMSIYGQCSACSAKIEEDVKTFIRLEQM